MILCLIRVQVSIRKWITGPEPRPLARVSQPSGKATTKPSHQTHPVQMAHSIFAMVFSAICCSEGGYPGFVPARLVRSKEHPGEKGEDHVLDIRCSIWPFTSINIFRRPDGQIFPPLGSSVRTSEVLLGPQGFRGSDIFLQRGRFACARDPRAWVRCAC